MDFSLEPVSSADRAAAELARMMQDGATPSALLAAKRLDPPPTPREMRRLAWLNAVAVLVHGGGALTFAIARESIFDWRYQITRVAFRRTGFMTGTGAPEFELFANKLFEGAFWVWPFGFPAITCLVHAFFLWGYFAGWYQQMLARRINPFRWCEYSFTASWMLVAVSLLSMVSDLHTLLLVFFANFTVMAAGAFVELRPGREKFALTDSRLQWDWYGLGLFWFTVPVFLVAWAPAYTQFIDNASEAPSFVWAVMIGIFILFNTFPVNMYFVEAGRIRYVTGEMVYIVLSLVSKTLLWALIAGGGTRDDVPPEISIS